MQVSVCLKRQLIKSFQSNQPITQYKKVAKAKVFALVTFLY
ncbi:hypothetical protein HMPREF9104_02213 [Lentilactobacillus kisonensis F0435]|uniref:Uncharacterized protein n=1 Tax=Lentilactobacillus kisonensis F0435 TaxID=797516 RepID=H1LHX2_9LACO|nr:hypothetical protein HMPREF9104_02213 [Lentilactobacillus kisonensis F0435]